MPITSLGLNYPFHKRVSSGIPSLDIMLGQRFYRGSTLLVSGTAGTGKQASPYILPRQPANGEKCFLPSKNHPGRSCATCSIGIDRAPSGKEQLRFEATRPTIRVEEHLAKMYKNIDEFQPEIVVIDPINAFVTIKTNLRLSSC